MPDKVYIDSNYETSLDDLTTIDQCDDARARLTGAIAALKEEVERHPDNRGAKTALRYRKFALQRIQEIRADLRRNDLLDIIMDLDPDIVYEARTIQRKENQSHVAT